tara:strand:- start:2697 stop:3152 length:456 start_codon:yes stop_codon:yes gene_type:complete
VIILQIQEITELIRINGQDSEKTTQLISELTTQKDWDKIYQISEFFGQEISILVDAQERIFVDWGSISRVELTPPLGSVVPFKLWLHTHPRNQAFWSETDQYSLFIAERILEQAIVLGMDGILSTSNTNLLELKPSINQSCWTLEQVASWS